MQAMKSAGRASRRRNVTSVDLGDLREGVLVRSAAAGVRPSTWLRGLVAQELSRHANESCADALLVQEMSANATERPVHRAWLDAGLTAKLDTLVATEGFRSRAAALRAVLAGLPLSDRAVRLSTRDAVTALGLSNHYLVNLRRQLEQMARFLRTTDSFASADVLMASARSIDDHLSLAAQVVAQVRPLLASPGKKA